MNATMLAAVMPATPANGPAAAHKSARTDDDGAAGDFAGRMTQAMDAAGAGEATTAAASRDQGERSAAGDAAAPAEAPAAEIVAPALPDLSALLPGWTAPPPQAAALVGNDALTAAAAAIEALSAKTALRGASSAESAAMASAQAASNAPSNAAPGAMPDAASAVAQVAVGSAGAQANNGSAAARPAHETGSAARDDSVAAPNTLALPSVQTPALAAAPRAADAATTTAHVAAPIDSPAFAPTLATQVRWWAQDGVQQAQLTLNPAEMGPVAVRIVVLDGREARIDFSADFAATRSAIEAALPVLAAALDDSGLKLAGGGVHDGSAQRQSNWAQAQAVTDRTPAHGNPRAVEALSAAPGATRAAGRGIVDLVA